MANAVRVHQCGGPEVLTFEQVETAEPGPGEVRIAQSAVGLNFIDVYHRTGLYPLELPCPIGMEAAGTIEAVGEDVGQFHEGDRVAYASPPVGAYTDQRVIAADRIVKLPDAISEEMAASIMLQGMTAEYLIKRTFPVETGQTVLFHAAAGGVGLLACQWLKQIGATVIGTVGNADKAALAQEHGCDHTIIYSDENFVDRVREITDGQGVPVVFDSVGASTFEGSLDCLLPRGMLVSFGSASGPVPPFNLAMLAQKGSLYVTRPTLMTYTASHEELVESANELFEAVHRGLRVNINQRYPLKDAEQAHRDLEARKTTGSTILIP